MQAIGKRSSFDASAVTRPRVQTMIASSSSSSLGSNGSPVSAHPDELVRTVDELAEDADNHLDSALRNQAVVAADVERLMQLLRQVCYLRCVHKDYVDRLTCLSP